MSGYTQSNSRGHAGGPRHNSDFLKFWAGQSISLLGSQVTTLALPLTAAITLQATPMEMGILGAIQYVPFLLFGLFVGVWVDRLRRRPILIIANLGRGLLLGIIPLAAFFGLLQIWQLYVVGFLTGCLSVCFDVAYQSYMPVLVGREHLVEANSKLQTSSSMAAIAGPSLAGLLVQWMAAPLVITIDAISFFISTLFLGIIRRQETAPLSGTERRGIWKEMGEGLRMVLSHPILRAIVGGTATSNFFINMQISVRLLYAMRDLRLEPATMGFIFATGSLGGLTAALFARRISRRAGIGPTIIGTQLLVGISALMLPLAGGGLVILVSIIVFSMLLWGFAMMTYDINQVSFRQAVTPDRLQGRMNASIRFVTWGVAPLGALLGGALGGLLGLRQTLLIGGIGVVCSALWTILSPTRNLYQIPASMIADEREAAALERPVEASARTTS